MPSHPRASRRWILAITATLASVAGAAGCASTSNGVHVTPPTVAPTSTSGPGSTTTTEVILFTGRPLRRRRGGARIGRSRRGARSVLRIAVPGLGPTDRARLAAHWRRLAEMEHASIAAFEQLQRQLVHLDAPAELVEGCARAAMQETDHARRCFELASVYDGAAIEAGRVRLPRLGNPSLAKVAAESLRDGVLNEGYAAWTAAAQAELASDPTVRETLEVIARDEADHAAFSWLVLAWCVQAGGDRVRVAVREAAEALPRISPSVGEGPAVLDHGMGDVDPDAAGFETIRDDVRRRVARLLATTSPIDATAPI